MNWLKELPRAIASNVQTNVSYMLAQTIPRDFPRVVGVQLNLVNHEFDDMEMLGRHLQKAGFLQRHVEKYCKLTNSAHWPQQVRSLNEIQQKDLLFSLVGRWIGSFKHRRNSDLDVVIFLAYDNDHLESDFAVVLWKHEGLQSFYLKTHVDKEVRKREGKEEKERSKKDWHVTANDVAVALADFQGFKIHNGQPGSSKTSSQQQQQQMEYYVV